MKQTPKQYLALVSTVLVMQLSIPTCLQLFPKVFEGHPLRKLALFVLILSTTLPILLRAHRNAGRDAQRPG